MTNVSAFCTKLLGGAVLISSNWAVRAALWMPFPCLCGRRATGKECLFSSYWFFFSFPICVVPLTPPWNSRFLQSDFKMFCGSASGSQPVLQFFQNFSDYFLVPASKSFILTKYLQYWLLGLKLGGSATFYLQFLHEDIVSWINVAANFDAANKAEVRFALAKYNILG